MKHDNNDGFRTLPVGTILENNYKILSVLGDGGFGITYRGFDLLKNREVAIKEYYPHEYAYRDMSSGESSRCYTIYPLQSVQKPFEKGKAHFLREATVLKNLEHLPSIVTVLDILKTNGTIYIVMEYIEGITLQKFIQDNGALSYGEFLPMILPIIKDLQQIHESGLIHRDISPDNLILGMDNRLHLIDFGSSTHFYRTGKPSTTVFLKSGYAPPEQYLENGKQGPWIDVYGLCATMYMALTRIQPPDSLNRLQAEKLPSLTANSDIPKNAATVIEKGMALKIADRYPSMTALYQALTRHTSGQRFRKWHSLIAVCVIGVLLFTAYLILQLRQTGGTGVVNTAPSAMTTGATQSATTEASSTTETSAIRTSSESGKTTEDSDNKGSTSEVSTENIASGSHSSEADTSKQNRPTEPQATTGESYKVQPIEEDDYQVLPLED